MTYRIDNIAQLVFQGAFDLDLRERLERARIKELDLLVVGNPQDVSHSAKLRPVEDAFTGKLDTPPREVPREPVAPRTLRDVNVGH